MMPPLLFLTGLLAARDYPMPPYCECPKAPAPYDHLLRVAKECKEHGPQPVLFDLTAAAERVAKVSQSPMAVHSLCEAGWVRESGGWVNAAWEMIPTSVPLTQAEAYATLLWQDGNLF